MRINLTQTERLLAEKDDRIRRLTRQCAELQVEVKELRLVNNRVFEVLRGGL